MEREAFSISQEGSLAYIPETGENCQPRGSSPLGFSNQWHLCEGNRGLLADGGEICRIVLFLRWLRAPGCLT